MRRLHADEHGVAVIESLGLLPYLVLAAVASFQMLLVAATVVAAENAARTGARVAATGGDGAAAAVEALPRFAWGTAPATDGGAVCPAEAEGEDEEGGVDGPAAEPGDGPATDPEGAEGRDVPPEEDEECRLLGARVSAPGRVTVTVGAPLLFPGLPPDALTVTRTAEFPPSGASG